MREVEELTIPLTEVKSSSNVRGVGYDPATKTLDVQFGNATYRHRNVPTEVFDRLVAAEKDDEQSVGKAYNELLRNKPEFPFERL